MFRVMFHPNIPLREGFILPYTLVLASLNFRRMCHYQGGAILYRVSARKKLVAGRVSPVNMTVWIRALRVTHAKNATPAWILG